MTQECLLAERFDRGSFVIFHVEDGIKLRNLQQIMDLLREVEQLKLPTLIADRRKCAHQLSDAGAVDISDITQVQQDLLLALAQQLTDLVAQHDAAFAERDTSAEVHDGHAVNATAI